MSEENLITFHLETDLSSKGVPAGDVTFKKSDIESKVFEDWDFDSWEDFRKEYDDVAIERLIDMFDVVKPESK